MLGTKLKGECTRKKLARSFEKVTCPTRVLSKNLAAKIGAMIFSFQTQATDPG